MHYGGSRRSRTAMGTVTRTMSESDIRCHHEHTWRPALKTWSRENNDPPTPRRVGFCAGRNFLDTVLLVFACCVLFSVTAMGQDPAPSNQAATGGVTGQCSPDPKTGACLPQPAAPSSGAPGSPAATTVPNVVVKESQPPAQGK